MRNGAPLAAVALLCACKEPVGLTRSLDTLVVRDCAGPANSLSPALAAALPPRTGIMVPDDKWADLAGTVPGGFAGVWFENPGQKPILMLTRPAEAAAAKAALNGQVPGFPIASAEVRQARWDFLQLVNWYNYAVSQGVFDVEGVTLGDKNERLNRIVFGAVDTVAMKALAAALVDLDVPCDLARVVRVGPITFDRRTP